MNVTDIIKFISLILAISVAGERLVTFLKTLVPPLAGPSPADPPPYPQADRPRAVAVMAIAFLAAWLTSGFLAKSDFMLGKIEIVPGFDLPCYFMGILASGGSAFWTNVLGYFKAIKDISTQKSEQERIKTLALKNNNLKS